MLSEIITNDHLPAISRNNFIQHDPTKHDINFNVQHGIENYDYWERPNYKLSQLEQGQYSLDHKKPNLANLDLKHYNHGNNYGHSNTKGIFFCKFCCVKFELF